MATARGVERQAIAAMNPRCSLTGGDSVPQRRAPSSPDSCPVKSVSCSACRTVKAKCVTGEGREACTRCTRRGQGCERPPLQKSGRPKGSKNQNTALERALKIIEREVSQQAGPSKRPRLERDRGDGDSSSSHGESSRSRHVPSASCPPQPTYEQLPTPSTTSIPFGDFHPFPDGRQGAVHPPPDHHKQWQAMQSISPHSLASIHSSQPGAMTHEHDGGLSNPVRLLAEAAEESSAHDHQGSETTVRLDDLHEPILPPQYSLPETLHSILTDGAEAVHANVTSISLDSEYLAQGLEALLSVNARRKLDSEDKRFFKPPCKEVKRDLGPEYDPLALALLTAKEVKAFFGSFFLKLHPMLPVLDPILHTPEFVQSRSAFLFTAICAHGASLTPGAEEATKRLRKHTQRLSELISRRGFASVEIVEAFLIWISWLPSSEPFQEERLWHETKYAISMAVELELAKTLPADPRESTDAALAACLEGVQIDVWDTVERIVRNRQRLWIHLFLWDSSLSLAFGKPTRFTQDALIRDERWCFHRLATKEDAVTTACVVLRRLLVGLSDMLRSEIHIRDGMPSGWVAEKIDDVLDPWHSYWSQQCAGSAYLQLVFLHTRLWSLSYALQALTSRGGPVEALINDCYLAALSSCEFVCEQLRASRGLWGFPNTMGPMLSYEALLAIRTSEAALAPKARLLGLLSQLSLLLEQVGTTPPHRLGTSAVYGRHLQVYIRRRVIGLCISHHQQEMSRFHGAGQGGGDLLFGSQVSPMQPAEASINQLFISNQSSTTDQAQASMNLNWDGAHTLNFLDTTTGWTDDFFRLFGGDQ